MSRPAIPHRTQRQPGPQAAERLAEAECGKLPQPPDFTADTHRYLRA